MITNMKSVNIINHPLTVPKFHGHMKLELRGCRETEIIEHDNNMTDALEMMLDSYGLWSNPFESFDALCPTLENAFGGILLTDKALDGCIAVPGGTEVTACAKYNTANSDLALTQGSCNQTESILDLPSKKMTYVYDWTTNQGNGIIAAAALTNANGGMCAYGDSGLNLYNSFKYNICGGSSIYNYRYSSKGTILCMVNDDYEVHAKISNKKLTVYKVNGVTKCVPAIFIKKDNYTDLLSYSDYEVKEFTTTNLTAINNTYTDGTNVYFLNTDTVYAGNTFILYKLNTIDMSLSEISIKNQTEKNLYLGYGFEIYNDYLYVNGNNYYIMYEINITNPADSNCYDFGATKGIYLNKLINLHNGKIFILSYQKVIVFDTITKTIKATKLYWSNNYRLCNQSLCPIYDTSSGTPSNSKRFLPFIYLATNNNLDKPVTKTADKTMKVTYSIQEV